MKIIGFLLLLLSTVLCRAEATYTTIKQQSNLYVENDIVDAVPPVTFSVGDFARTNAALENKYAPTSIANPKETRPRVFVVPDATDHQYKVVIVSVNSLNSSQIEEITTYVSRLMMPPAR
jgi:hypothetical protein